MPEQRLPQLNEQNALSVLRDHPDEWSALKRLVTGLPSRQRASCPACGAVEVQVANVESKDLLAGVVAEWAFESTAAGVTEGTSHTICNVCVACGRQWVPGSPQEALARLFAGQLGSEERNQLVARLDQQLGESQKENHRLANSVILILLLGAALVALLVLL